MSRPQWDNSREVFERIHVEGLLELDTPAHFGNGEVGGLLDIPLQYDSIESDMPLLTGSSIAGALRSYLREYDDGYGFAESPLSSQKTRAERLFGHLVDFDQTRSARKEKTSVLSWLFVDDARGVLPGVECPVEIRNGVAIEPKSRTAEEKKKYDIELLPAGTVFTINLELWLKEHDRELVEALAVALDGMEKGKIGLGMRKRRGLGQCRVNGWKVRRYNMKNVDHVLEWLGGGRLSDDAYKPGILSLLAVTPGQSRTEAFRLKADFRLEDSILIGSDTGSLDSADVIHLRSLRGEGAAPVLSGTSLAGAVRSRAFRIASTLKGEQQAQELVDGMFGKRIKSAKDVPTGSRVICSETRIVGGCIDDRIQSRVKLDRFTGGAYPGALFSEQPLFSGTDNPAQVEIDIELRKTTNTKQKDFEAEVGLLLLVLKDLWTGDLPLGGGASVGRGRLRGQKAELSLGERTWIIEETPGGRLRFGGDGDQTELQDKFLAALLPKEDGK